MVGAEGKPTGRSSPPGLNPYGGPAQSLRWTGSILTVEMPVLNDSGHLRAEKVNGTER